MAKLLRVSDMTHKRVMDLAKELSDSSGRAYSANDIVALLLMKRETDQRRAQAAVPLEAP
jgi:hypothetical protein